MYHVALALSPEQVKRLKQLALASDKSVRDFVTDLVVREIENADRESKQKGGE